MPAHCRSKSVNRGEEKNTRQLDAKSINRMALHDMKPLRGPIVAKIPDTTEYCCIESAVFVTAFLYHIQFSGNSKPFREKAVGKKGPRIGLAVQMPVLLAQSPILILSISVHFNS